MLLIYLYVLFSQNNIIALRMQSWQLLMNFHKISTFYPKR